MSVCVPFVPLVRARCDADEVFGEMLFDELLVVVTCEHSSCPVQSLCLEYPQPDGGAHPSIPSERGLGELLWRLG